MNWFADAYLQWLKNSIGVATSPVSVPQEFIEFALRLPPRIRSAVRQMGIESYDVLTTKTADDWMECRNFGEMSLSELNAIFTKSGIPQPAGIDWYLKSRDE